MFAVVSQAEFLKVLKFIFSNFYGLESLGKETRS